MGPSKFPGKPSKLVQKRVSVVTGRSTHFDHHNRSNSASDHSDESETNAVTSTTRSLFLGDADAQVRDYKKTIYMYSYNIRSI